MTTHDDSSINRLLRDLDPADRELSQAQRARAGLTLERIVATDPPISTPTPTPGGTTGRRTRFALLAGGVVAAVTAAVVTVPIVTGGSQAFASWSPTPVELHGAARAAALKACLVLQSSHDGELALEPNGHGSALLAEARGGWNYVVFTAPGPSGRRLQGSCLVPDDLVADPRPGEGGFFGSLGGAEETASQPAREVVREDTSGLGSVDDGAFVYAEGRVGADVVRIEVTTPSGRQVEASIENGRWGVWWPVGDASMENPDLAEARTYRVTLRDGTVVDHIRTLRTNG
jgi:hypothetical protein